MTIFHWTIDTLCLSLRIQDFQFLIQNNFSVLFIFFISNRCMQLQLIIIESYVIESRKYYLLFLFRNEIRSHFVVKKKLENIYFKLLTRYNHLLLEQLKTMPSFQNSMIRCSYLIHPLSTIEGLVLFSIFENPVWISVK